jgi:ceramide glucosyltransferase
MTLSELTMAMWLAFTAFPLWGAMFLALRRMRAVRSTGLENGKAPVLSIQVFVPVKGSFPDQEQVLGSLLEQGYPRYTVTFVLEDEGDRAIPVVDALCRKYAHAAKVISGLSFSCAQKNHNLVQATNDLSPETRILLFCDSTNAASPNWLERLTVPLRNGTAEVVTTFRAFDPKPETIGGVCQAIYAAFLVLLQVNKPTPWGGATAILRETFDRLAVREAWSNTVVDDLILGSVLDRAGVETVVDPAALLRSPLRGQTVSGFLSYLDRQVLFPKFTHPVMWLQSLFSIVNVSIAVAVAICVGVLFPFGWATAGAAWASYIFLLLLTAFMTVLRRVTPVSVSFPGWMLGFLPCLTLCAYVFLRSIFRGYIDWHGRRYWPGRNGVVKEAHVLQGNPR